MSKSLYLECFSGISGDMFVAAMLDLGVSEEKLLAALNSIDADGFEIKISRKEKSGVEACDFDVVLKEGYENHDHDMEYLHGHSHEYSHGHEHEHHHSHGHEHSHEHEHSHGHEHNHDHIHRNLGDVIKIINSAGISDKARKLAVNIFEIVAKAEAKVHNKPLEEVHFHEVGAVDSIVDIIAAAVCITELGVDKVIVPIVYEGGGSIRCRHGILPVPVPASAAIIEEHKINIKLGTCEGELVTPTGAAIVASLKTSDSLPESFKILKVGIGAGKRKYNCAGILRAMLIEEEDEAGSDIVYKLESNIDDCSGEMLGYTLDRLLDAGALDVSYTPIFMKKNRPAYQINVITKREKLEEIKNIIFEETSTIGIRVYETERYVLPRNIRVLETEYGSIRVKECALPGGKKLSYPEYESLVKICKEKGLTYKELYNRIIGGL